MNTHIGANSRNESRERLMADITAAKAGIDTARENFNRVCRPEEVDVYIYRLREAEARYGCLLRKLKEL